MSPKVPLSPMQSPQEILTQAFNRRAEAYRRWCDAANQVTTAADQEVYRELAAIECDRFEEIAVRFFHQQEQTRPPAAMLVRPDWTPPEAGKTALRAAAAAAENEHRSWSALLRKAGQQAPERSLLEALIDDTNRVRDWVGRSHPVPES